MLLTAITFSDLDLNSISLSPAESPLLRKQWLFYFASSGMQEELPALFIWLLSADGVQCFTQQPSALLPV